MKPLQVIDDVKLNICGFSDWVLTPSLPLQYKCEHHATSVIVERQCTVVYSHLICLSTDISKWMCVHFVQEKEMLEVDLNTATSDQKKTEIERRLKEVESALQRRKSRVHDWERKANEAEEKLNQLESKKKKDEGLFCVEWCVVMMSVSMCSTLLMLSVAHHVM